MKEKEKKNWNIPEKKWSNILKEEKKKHGFLWWEKKWKFWKKKMSGNEIETNQFRKQEKKEWKYLDFLWWKGIPVGRLGG